MADLPHALDDEPHFDWDFRPREDLPTSNGEVELVRIFVLEDDLKIWRLLRQPSGEFEIETNWPDDENLVAVELGHKDIAHIYSVAPIGETNHRPSLSYGQELQVFRRIRLDYHWRSPIRDGGLAPLTMSELASLILELVWTRLSDDSHSIWTGGNQPILFQSNLYPEIHEFILILFQQSSQFDPAVHSLDVNQEIRRLFTEVDLQFSPSSYWQEDSVHVDAAAFGYGTYNIQHEVKIAELIQPRHQNEAAGDEWNAIVTASMYGRREPDKAHPHPLQHEEHRKVFIRCIETHNEEPKLYLSGLGPIAIESQPYPTWMFIEMLDRFLDLVKRPTSRSAFAPLQISSRVYPNLQVFFEERDKLRASAYRRVSIGEVLVTLEQIDMGFRPESYWSTETKALERGDLWGADNDPYPNEVEIVSSTTSVWWDREEVGGETTIVTAFKLDDDFLIGDEDIDDGDNESGDSRIYYRVISSETSPVGTSEIESSEEPLTLQELIDLIQPIIEDAWDDWYMDDCRLVQHLKFKYNSDLYPQLKYVL